MKDPAATERHRPIGVFDSGLGGLTVARSIRSVLPREDLLYLGDTARVPYGSKGTETVTRFTRECLEWLQERGVKMLVVACNTASALALPSLVNEFDLPVLGVIEPGVQSAVKRVRRGTVGVIGTRSTVASHAYGDRLRQLNRELDVVEQACPLFVPLVQEGWISHPITDRIVAEYLGPLRAHPVDAVILGCTHYPLLKAPLRSFFGEDVVLIDSAEETAREVVRLLSLKKMEAERTGSGQCTIYCTDDPERVVHMGRRVFWPDIESVHLARVGKE